MSPKKRPKIRIAANGYRLCDPLPKGEVLIDSTKNKWVLGTSIGSGGFGDIYSCRRLGDRKDDYVMKLDNKSGPLFAEMNFYQRVAQKELIREFKTKNKLKFLGIPEYIASGVHYKSSSSTKKPNPGDSQAKNARNAPTTEYRFLVMERFGEELTNCVLKKRLSAADVADIGVKMIDALHYIHTFGYIHADIKGTNILRSLGKASNEWYLVDYGLADRYCFQENKEHKEEKPDKKKSNNGTVEYRSRDAHIGQISRRSDIECLAYNLIQWLYGTLPWIKFLEKADKVEESKRQFMNNIDQSLHKCFTKSVPNGLAEFFKEVDKIGYKSEPKYSLFKQILLTKVSKSKTIIATNDDESDGEESDEEDNNEESDDEGSDDETVSNGRKTRSNSKPKPKSSQKRKSNNRKVQKKGTKANETIELSDSDEDCDDIVFKSPPKRPRNVNKTPNNIKNKSPLKTPNTNSRYTPPLLFGTSPEDDSSFRTTGGSQSELELSRGEGVVETPAMIEMRKMIERNKREKELNKKKNRKK